MSVVKDHPRTKASQINIRVEDDLATRIDELAEREGRSRANWAERALRAAVQKKMRTTVDKRVARG